MIIMIPNMIPLIENTVISILDAKKKRLFRSLVLFGISLINVLVSIILVNKYGMMGAPIGTAFAFIVGYGVVLNFYYDRVIGINVLHMFRKIFSKVWVCILIATLVSIPLNIVMKSYSLPTLLIKMCVFDVDGTLFDYYNNCVHASTIKALRKLQEKGILIAVATGRAHYGLGKALNDLHFDYICAVNGAVIADANQQVLIRHDFTREDVDQINEFAHQYDAGLAWKFIDHVYIYQHNV